jgi:hypothetical protein
VVAVCEVGVLEGNASALKFSARSADYWGLEIRGLNWRSAVLLARLRFGRKTGPNSGVRREIAGSRKLELVCVLRIEGGKAMAARIIMLTHRGVSDYSSDQVWEVRRRIWRSWARTGGWGFADNCVVKQTRAHDVPSR